MNHSSPGAVVKRSALVLAALALALAGAGCDKKPVVTGTVTLDGQPVERGAIQFFPVNGDGQTAGATIQNGQYRLEASPGQMRVVIKAPKVIGQRKAYDNEPDSPMIDTVRESLPAQYSDLKKSELTFTVAPGANEANFDLQSEQKK